MDLSRKYNIKAGEDQQLHLNQSSIVPGYQRVSADSRFSDSLWNMASRVHLPGMKRSNTQFDFSKCPGYPAGFALSLAEYAYARLENSVESSRSEVSWLTVRNDLHQLNQFAMFCSQSRLTNFAQVQARHYDEFLRTLCFPSTGKAKSERRVLDIVSAVYRLWDYRDRMTEGLRVQPYGKSFSQMFRSKQCRATENATSVIPEPVFAAGSLIALEYVLKHSLTILPAWQEMQHIYNFQIQPLKLPRRAEERLLHPTARGVLRKYSADWRFNGWTSIGHLYEEIHQLRTACIWVIIAFSGIRISELLSLQAGCAVTDSNGDGNKRYYINAHVHKHRGIGTKDTWVVVEEVIKAVHVLEQLMAPLRNATSNHKLFLSDRTSHTFGVHRKHSPENVYVLTNEAVVSKLKSFQAHSKNVLGKPIPDYISDDGTSRPWRFNTRQFRRTLARYIVRQPFGVIAGMLQYKHVEVAIFEGYAGHEPEWNKMLSDERILASINLLDEVAIDMSNGELGGEIGQKLNEQFAIEFKGRAEDFPPSQIAKWLANTAKPLFVGKFNFCFYESSKAKCTRNQPAAPVINHCQPDVCSNACIGSRHIPQWEAQLLQAQELANNPHASTIHKQAMSMEINKLQRVIATFGDKG